MREAQPHLQRFLTGARPQVIFGGILFLVMAALLVMSSRTGLKEFDKVQRQLDAIQGLNLRLDGALSWSSFEFQMDFDLITQLERELLAAVAEFQASFPERGSALARIVEDKLVAVEDFKTAQAVSRNSRAIAEQMIEALWNDEAVSRNSAEDLFAVERAFLGFLTRRDPPSGANLRSTVDDVDKKNIELTASPRWAPLKAHLSALSRYMANVGSVMQELFFMPLMPEIETQAADIAEQLSRASVVADRFRTALFAMAVVLLVFSVAMATRVRMYLRMIQRTNDALEARVEERTTEIAEVNAALRAEIAERENVESQLEIARKLEAIGQLAAGIAHEINTPAQYVSDNVTFLDGVWRGLGPLLDDYERSIIAGDSDSKRSRAIWEESDLAYLRGEVPTALHEAASGLEQISRIVLAMKTFSHPGGEGLQPSDINRALESTVTVARNEWKYVAELTLDLDQNLPPVPCDVSALNQAVLNLVVNAAQSIAESKNGDDLGRILVSSRCLGGYAEIRVEDDGPGVPESIRDRVFDPFFTTKEVGKGTGQGLAIAHRVVHQQHGGTLTLESGRWGGARFTIRLPLRLADSDPVRSPGSVRLIA